jgi:hypothetical protein
MAFTGISIPDKISCSCDNLALDAGRRQNFRLRPEALAIIRGQQAKGTKFLMRRIDWQS